MWQKERVLFAGVDVNTFEFPIRNSYTMQASVNRALLYAARQNQKWHSFILIIILQSNYSTTAYGYTGAYY